MTGDEPEQEVMMAWRTMIAALAIALLVSLSGELRAQGLSEADRSAFQSIILEQMEAFQADDGERAFSFAAPSIRERFGSSARFMSMVERGYEPVYRPNAVTFGDVTEELGQPTQRVHVIGPDGRAWIALYSMEAQADGTWRISGCVLLPSPDAGA